MIQLVDGLEGFAEGFQPTNVLHLTNGDYIGTTPWIRTLDVADEEQVNDIFGTRFSGATLGDNSIQNARTFTNLPTGTQYWGTDLAADPSAEFDLLIVGVSGTVLLESVRGGDLDGFLGVHDEQGLISISITTVDFSSSGGSGKGLGNYTFDNIVTAGL